MSKIRVVFFELEGSDEAIRSTLAEVAKQVQSASIMPPLPALDQPKPQDAGTRRVVALRRFGNCRSRAKPEPSRSPSIFHAEGRDPRGRPRGAKDER